jgi:hypothetical protein
MNPRRDATKTLFSLGGGKGRAVIAKRATHDVTLQVRGRERMSNYRTEGKGSGSAQYFYDSELYLMNKSIRI